MRHLPFWDGCWLGSFLPLQALRDAVGEPKASIRTHVESQLPFFLSSTARRIGTQSLLRFLDTRICYFPSDLAQVLLLRQLPNVNAVHLTNLDSLFPHYTDIRFRYAQDLRHRKLSSTSRFYRYDYHRKTFLQISTYLR